jgi:Lrp/AsnC family leucine-responsive transcriptional regulator
MARFKQLDRTDTALLGLLQRDCRIPLEVVARRLQIPKSTVHYRMKRLEKEGVVDGYYAKVNATRLGFDYLAVVLVRAKYGPGYHQKVGRRLAEVRGVWAVYYVLGEIDFIVLIRANDRDDYMRTLERISSMSDIERTSTQVVAKVVKEDPRVEIDWGRTKRSAEHDIAEQ